MLGISMGKTVRLDFGLLPAICLPGLHFEIETGSIAGVSMTRQSGRPQEHLSLVEARQIAIHGAGICCGNRSVTQSLEHLGVVQLDAINVVGRAHQLTLGARAPGITHKEIDVQLWGQGAPVAFEYMAHAASLLPIADWPLWSFRRRSTRSANLDWRPDNSLQKRLLKTVEENGPLSMRELRGNERAGQGWDWGPTKTAIEYLLWVGDLICVRREGWQRRFDMAERVVPPHHFTDDIEDQAAIAHLLTKAGAVLGVATADDLADYLRISKERVLAALPDTPLEAVLVEGWNETAWLTPDSPKETCPPVDAQFIGPFDNLIWYRPRLRRLFSVEHSLEAYKPAAKRKYGYYAMLLLVGSDFVARADMKIEAKALRLLSMHREGEREVAQGDLERALERLTRLAGLPSASVIDLRVSQ
ncbi:crosslink repair DNA glycosylase YcaQ family protein [Streptomyces sp. NPDC047002]|uniref:winged helix-turn-helix domain-containing protein n=1 Tax=Streptomyces sp. NPDC047002 TaxID=3155475 RepID=UPI0034524AF4